MEDLRVYVLREVHETGDRRRDMGGLRMTADECTCTRLWARKFALEVFELAKPTIPMSENFLEH